MDEWTNGRTKGRTDGQKDERTDKRTNGRKKGRTDGRMDEWTYGRMDECVNEVTIERMMSNIKYSFIVKSKKLF